MENQWIETSSLNICLLDLSMQQVTILHVCNLSTQEAKAGLLQVQVYLSNNVRLFKGKRERETTPVLPRQEKASAKARQRPE